MNTDKIFQELNKFKDLPSYQLERRIDAFMFPYLEIAINANKIIEGDDFKLIYPEFPIKRLGSESNLIVEKRAEYVDYLMWSKKSNTLLLIEFKTDSDSIRDNQFYNYNDLCNTSWVEMLNFYKLMSKSTKWKKYAAGLLLLQKEAPELITIPNSEKLDELRKSTNGTGATKIINEISVPDSCKLNSPQIRFIYLAPSKSDSKINKIINESKNVIDKYLGLLSLTDFTNHVDDLNFKKLLETL
jgi:hypothetical protein